MLHFLLSWLRQYLRLSLLFYDIGGFEVYFHFVEYLPIEICLIFFMIRLGSSFSWFLCSFYIHRNIFFFPFFNVFTNSLPLRDALGSSFIFSAPVLEWAIGFIGEWYYKTKPWEWICVCSWGVIASSSLSWHSKEMYLSPVTHTYMYMYLINYLNNY